MYCRKCGKQLEDVAKFCDSCGEQQTPSSPLNSAAVNAVMNDGKQLIKHFFSKNPAAAVKQAADSQTKTGIVLIILNILLFALVACFNCTQIINHMVKSATSAIAQTASSVLGSSIGGSMASQSIPDMKIPILFDLFLPLAVFALIITAILLATLYIIIKLKKLPLQSIYSFANVIGVAGLPITAALVANFILGFLFPSLTSFVFIAAVLISLVTLYEGIKALSKSDKEPIPEFAILTAVICIIAAIALQIALSQVGKAVQEVVSSAVSSGLDGLGGMLGGMLG